MNREEGQSWSREDRGREITEMLVSSRALVGWVSALALSGALARPHEPHAVDLGRILVKSLGYQ